MAKHAQTVGREIAGEFFEYVWPFCGIGAERVNYRGVGKEGRGGEKGLYKCNQWKIIKIS